MSINEFYESVEYDLQHSDVGKRLMNDYDLVSLTHKGRNSEIYLISNNKNDLIYTLKCIKKQKDLTFNFNGLKLLNSTHIVPIIETVESENYYYIIKQFIEGENLSDYILKNGPLKNRMLDKFVETICSVFKDLHINQATPIIYRDLKPENIILTPTNEFVLIDPETCRLIKHENTSDTFYVGTHGYASPEQYGFNQSDERSDIYTIGTTLYFALTGYKPIADIERKYLKNVPLKWRKIIVKCTRFNPRKRYQSITKLDYAMKKTTRPLTNPIIYLTLILSMSTIGVYFLLSQQVNSLMSESIREQDESDSVFESDSKFSLEKDLLPVLDEERFGNIIALNEYELYDRNEYIEEMEQENNKSENQSQDAGDEVLITSTHNAIDEVVDDPEKNDKEDLVEDDSAEIIEETHYASVENVILDMNPIGEALIVHESKNVFTFDLDEAKLRSEQKMFTYFSVIPTKEMESDSTIKEAIYTSVIFKTNVLAYEVGDGYKIDLDWNNKGYILLIMNEDYECLGYYYYNLDDFTPSANSSLNDESIQNDKQDLIPQNISEYVTLTDMGNMVNVAIDREGLPEVLQSFEYLHIYQLQENLSDGVIRYYMDDAQNFTSGISRYNDEFGLNTGYADVQYGYLSFIMDSEYNVIGYSYNNLK
ncbi:MAG: protein kinase [Clostridia bacterium]|nr:protein kinase [Clostridia bacterium]